MDIQQTMLNLFALNGRADCLSDGLMQPNTVVFANSHGRILGRQQIDQPLTLPKGTHKIRMGRLIFETT